MVDQNPHLDFTNLIHRSSKAMKCFDDFSKNEALERFRSLSVAKTFLSKGFVINKTKSEGS